jgi:ABC-2 type transport system permease protein
LKVFATIRKEFLLLTRDLGGLALIFLMPLALVTVMALIQDNTFRELQETGLDVLFVDEDRDVLGASIEKNFQASSNIRLIRKTGSETLTAEAARRLVQSGRYKTAIIIPEHATVILRKKTQRAVTRLLAHYGLTPEQTDTKVEPAVDVQIFFDPVIKANYKQTLASAVEKMIANVQSEWLMDEIQKHLGEATQKQKIQIDFSQMIRVTLCNTMYPPGPCLPCFLFFFPSPGT